MKIKQCHIIIVERFYNTLENILWNNISHNEIDESVITDLWGILPSNIKFDLAELTLWIEIDRMKINQCHQAKFSHTDNHFEADLWNETYHYIEGLPRTELWNLLSMNNKRILTEIIHMNKGQ